jgi:hypothetical protein
MKYDHFSMLPERAFQPRSKVFSSGGMTLEGGSSGGGGSAQPTSTTTTQTTIPEYAQPYMERLLGKSEAASEAPYQTYGGERLVGATPEQQAARAGVAGLQTPGQFYGGTGFLGAGGLGSLMAGQQYMGMATSPGAQQAFMSPYMQNVVDVQKQEALRNAQQAQLTANLGAARQGTYGGARQLLATTERERNLQDQMAQIQATGSQRAFEAAQQAMQFGTQAGLSGYGQAIQAGQGLGQIGAAQQQADLSRLQAQEMAGSLTQRDQQAALDLAYQDFLAQQRYPYSQLGFMSDILRGSGNLAATGGTALYQAPPSTGSQLLGLATTLGGAYLAGGAPKLFAEGGEVKGLSAIRGYADGGLIDNMVDVAKLTPDQIEQTTGPNVRPDVPDILLLAELDRKLAQIQAAKGQGGLPQTNAAEDIRAEAAQEAMGGINSIPIADDYYRSEEETTQMAGGGIVAFARGGEADIGGIRYPDGSVGYAWPGLIAAGKAGLGWLGRDIGVRGAAGVVKGAGRGAAGVGRAAARNPVTAAGVVGGTGYGLYDYVTGEPGEEVAVTEEAPAKEEKAPKVEVSDKTLKKVQKAEDEYEKALKAELDKTDMSKEDKMEALGFALMKAGAKTMAGKSQYALQNIGEGIEAGADEYVKTLSQAKKDKRQLTKDLAEYNLAKEKNRIAEQSATAQLAQAEASMVRAERTGTQAERTALIKAWQDEMKITPADKRLPFPVWLQTQGFSGAPTSTTTPTDNIRSFYR